MLSIKGKVGGDAEARRGWGARETESIGETHIEKFRCKNFFSFSPQRHYPPAPMLLCLTPKKYHATLNICFDKTYLTGRYEQRVRIP